MIACAKPVPDPAATQAAPPWQAAFLELLPAIQSYARCAFRNWPYQARRDALDEVTANALVAFTRLVALGKSDLAYATPLARFAVKQVREGRQVGCRLRVRDVMSPYAQRQKGFQLQRLDHFEPIENAWLEVLVEDKRATPAEMAACRIDFAAWLSMLPRRYRQIARLLATSETTGAVARRFGVSSARISQIRGELRTAWNEFQGEGPDTTISRAVAAA